MIIIDLYTKKTDTTPSPLLALITLCLVHPSLLSYQWHFERHLSTSWAW